MDELIISTVTEEIEKLLAEKQSLRQQAIDQVDKWMTVRVQSEGAITALKELTERLESDSEESKKAQES